MKCTVTWTTPARDELADLWLKAHDKQAITAAANRIDQILRSDPHRKGESRSGFERILIVAPLAAIFEVHADDRIVTVLSVRYFLSHPPH